ncbi:serine-rich adhesin for platelets-like [Branchiostoma lanceolatum]|uniref:serine-rich adhesin for platelets-like n=1 Tax=Branchiostoma lanceolatum TaxID=7740 RepID=UPI003451142B
MATVQRLTLPQRAGSAKGCFVMPKAWVSHGGSSADGSELSLSEWMNYPLDTKMPLIPGIEKAMVLYTTDLGERLHARPNDHDFDLTDPCGHQMSTEYNLLHDPHLKPFYSFPGVKQRLVRNGFITQDGKVLCTLKEFNQYRQYLRKISLDYYNNERRRQLEDAVLARERAEHKKKESKAQSESLQIIKSRREKAKETRQKLREQEEASKRRYMALMRKDAMKRNLLQVDKTLHHEEERKRKDKEWESKRSKFQLNQDKERRRRKKAMEAWKAEERERQRRLEERRRQEQKEKEEKTMDHFVEHARLRALQREEMLRVEEEERQRRQENIRAREAAIQAQRQKQYEIFLKRKQQQQERRERTQKTLLSMWRDKTKAGKSDGKTASGTDVSTGGKGGLFSRFKGIKEGTESAKGEAEKKGAGLNLGRLVDRAIDKTMEDFEKAPRLPQEEQSPEETAPPLPQKEQSPERIESFVGEPAASKKQGKPATRTPVKRKTGTRGKKISFKFKVDKESMARLQSEFPGAKLIDVDELRRQEEEKTRQEELLIMQLQTDFPGANVSLEGEEGEETLEEVELQQVLSRSQTTLLHMRAAEIVRAVMETVSKVIIPRMVSEDKFTSSVEQEPRRSDTRVLNQVASDMVTSALDKLKTEMTEDVTDYGTRRVSREASQLVFSVIDGVKKEFSKENVAEDRKLDVRKSTSDSSLLTRTARDIVACVIDGVTKELTGQRSDMSAMSLTKTRSDTSLIGRTACQVVSSVVTAAKKPSKVQPALSESATVREMATQITSWVIERVRQEMADGSSEASAESFDDSCLEREILRTMRADSTPVEEPYSRPLSPEPSSDAEISRAGSKQSAVTKLPRVPDTQSQKPSTGEITSRHASKEAVLSKSSSSQKIRLVAPTSGTSVKKSRTSIKTSRTSVKTSRTSVKTSWTSVKTSRTSIKTSPATSKVLPSPKTSTVTATPTRKLSRSSRESVISLSRKSTSDSVVRKTSKTSTSLSGHTMSATEVRKMLQQRSEESFRPSQTALTEKLSSKEPPVLPEVSTGKVSEKPSKEKATGDLVTTKTSVVKPNGKASLEQTGLSSDTVTSVDNSDATAKQAKTSSSKDEIIAPKTLASATQASLERRESSIESGHSGRRTSISAPGLDVKRSSSKSLKKIASLHKRSSGGAVVRSGPSMSGADVKEIQQDDNEGKQEDADERVVKTAPSTPLLEDDAQLAGEAVMPSSMSEGSVKAKRSVNKVSSTQSAWSATPSKKASSQSSSLTKPRESQSTMMSPSGTKVSAKKSISKHTPQTGISTSQLGSSSRTPSVEKPTSRSSIKANSSKSGSEVTATTFRSSGSSLLRKTRSNIATPAAEKKTDVRLKASKSGQSRTSSIQAGKTSSSSTHDAKRSSSSVRNTFSKTKSSSSVKPSQSKSKDSVKGRPEISAESETSKQESEETTQIEEMEGDLDEDLHLDEDEEEDFGGDTEEPPAKDMQLLGAETQLSDVSDVEDEEVLTETENVVIKKRRESLVGAGAEEVPKTMSGSKASMKSYRRHSIAGSCATLEVDRSEFAPLEPTLQGRTVDLDDDLRENLSAISVKASFQDRMQDEITPRNSFRCLQKPELSSTQGLEREESLRSLITKRRMSLPSGVSLASFRAENSSEDIVQVNTMFDVGEFSRGVRRYSEVPKKPVAMHRPETDSSASLERIPESKENKP